MAENKTSVSFLDLAVVIKYIDPNMNLCKAEIWVSELKKCISNMLIDTPRPLLAFFSEDALRVGLSVAGTANEKIQAAKNYMETHPTSKPANYTDSHFTSPQQILNELLEAFKGNINYCKDAKSTEYCNISVFSPEVLLLAAQTFMFRNKHYDVSDEEALQAFNKAIQYLNGEERTSTEFIKCDSSELSEIIRHVNHYFTVESIDVIGLKITKRVMESINEDTEPEVSDDPAILKRFQDAKINGVCADKFRGTPKYIWSRDGKPPAHPYFTVAQLYWPHLYDEIKFLQIQSKREVTDKEALTVLYEEIPRLKGKSNVTFKTYTWFLNKPSDAKLNIPELRDYSVGQTFSEDYLSPSTEPLQTEGFRYEWSRDEHENTHQDFTLIYRARPTLERVPPLITEENRIRFDYWQYIKEFVFFGGSHLEGAVLAPDPAWIDAAHVNGVAIFGTVFLPPLNCGGDVRDLEELAKPESLQKLIDIAHQLNFEGWFLNVESFDNNDEPSLGELKRSLENLDLKGKKLIWYLPDNYESDRFDPKSEGVTMTYDNKINNTAYAFLEEKGKKLHLNFQELLEVFFGQTLQKYLMFVDEPFWQNEQKYNIQRKYRFVYAQNCHWQFFLGENGLERKPTDPHPWYGIAKYAMERKQ